MSFTCSVGRNICGKIEGTKSRQKPGGSKERCIGKNIFRNSQFRKAEICAYAGPLCMHEHHRSTESHLINTRQHQSTFSPSSQLVILDTEKHHTICPQEKPHNAVSSAPCRHHWYCKTAPILKAGVDSHADWDNIGFKVREGMCEHAALTPTAS